MIFMLLLIAGCSATEKSLAPRFQTDAVPYHGIILDTVKAKKFDTGRMWTFDYPPVEYFEGTYGFKPTEQWLEKVRLSALKFGTWCTASFVSGSGLVMTNYHCSDNLIDGIQKEGEDLRASGFYAEKPEDERKVSGLFVDQLILIRDITGELHTISGEGLSPEQYQKKRETALTEIQKKYSDETGLICEAVPLYEGAKYSIYGYRRYSDIRAVFIPETEIGLYGGDPDNFTYPRYSLDCSFFRVYGEDGKPLDTENYFPFSKEGARENQPVFVIGNPGNTDEHSIQGDPTVHADPRYQYTERIFHDNVVPPNQPPP